MTFVPRVKGMSYLQIELEACKHRERLFPGTIALPRPVDVEQTWEILGDEFCTLISDSLPDGIEGRTWPDGRVEISETTYLRMLRNDPRSRFTVIHECAHAILHVHQIKRVIESSSKLTLNRRQDIPSYEDPEWQANAFTGAFLMPRDACVYLQRKSGYLTPHQLMEAFCVSYTAASRRIEVLMRK
jgi:hypothetical protein